MYESALLEMGQAETLRTPNESVGEYSVFVNGADSHADNHEVGAHMQDHMKTQDMLLPSSFPIMQETGHDMTEDVGEGSQEGIVEGSQGSSRSSQGLQTIEGSQGSQGSHDTSSGPVILSSSTPPSSPTIVLPSIEIHSRNHAVIRLVTKRSSSTNQRKRAPKRNFEKLRRTNEVPSWNTHSPDSPSYHEYHNNNQNDNSPANMNIDGKKRCPRTISQSYPTNIVSGEDRLALLYPEVLSNAHILNDPPEKDNGEVLHDDARSGRASVSWRDDQNAVRSIGGGVRSMRSDFQSWGDLGVQEVS